MFQNVLHFHRTECPKPHMKRHMCNKNTLFLNLPEKLRRKMQPRRRRRSGTVVLCVDGLIAVFVLQLMRDIRRKRHLPKLIQDLLKDSFILKPDLPIPVLDHFQHFSRQKAAAKEDFRARFCLFPRLYQRLPHIVFPSFQKKHLDLCSRLCPASDQTRRNDLRIIHCQAVSRVQIIDNVSEYVMFCLPGLTVQQQKPGP